MLTGAPAPVAAAPVAPAVPAGVEHAAARRLAELPPRVRPSDQTASVPRPRPRP